MAALLKMVAVAGPVPAWPKSSIPKAVCPLVYDPAEGKKSGFQLCRVLEKWRCIHLHTESAFLFVFVFEMRIHVQPSRLARFFKDPD